RASPKARRPVEAAVGAARPVPVGQVFRGRGDCPKRGQDSLEEKSRSPMTFPLKPPIPPMEALLVAEIPEEPGWQYEPKWDGFRCLAFRDGDKVYLQSKAEKPLARYFPEVVAAVGSLKARRFVLDGEMVVPLDGRLAFDELLQRIHPAESRIRKLAAERPALLIAFD